MHSSVYQSHEGGSSVPSPAAARETSEPPVSEAPKKTGLGGDRDTIPGTMLSLLGSVGAPQL